MDIIKNEDIIQKQQSYISFKDLYFKNPSTSSLNIHFKLRYKLHKNIIKKSR